MCVRNVDVQCVLQFTLLLAVGCVLHRPTSRVIHRSELYFLPALTDMFEIRKSRPIRAFVLLFVVSHFSHSEKWGTRNKDEYGGSPEPNITLKFQFYDGDVLGTSRFKRC